MTFCLCLMAFKSQLSLIEISPHLFNIAIPTFEIPTMAHLYTFDFHIPFCSITNLSLFSYKIQISIQFHTKNHRIYKKNPYLFAWLLFFSTICYPLIETKFGLKSSPLSLGHVWLSKTFFFFFKFQFISFRSLGSPLFEINLGIILF